MNLLFYLVNKVKLQLGEFLVDDAIDEKDICILERPMQLIQHEMSGVTRDTPMSIHTIWCGWSHPRRQVTVATQRPN